MTFKEILVTWLRRMLPYPDTVGIDNWPQEFSSAVEQNLIELEYALASINRRLSEVTQEYGTFLVGDTVASGDVCVLSTNGEMIPAVATNKIYARGLIGLAVEAAGATQTARFLLRGFVPDNTFDAGDLLYLDTTVGQMTPTQPSASGQIVRLLGYKLANDNIFFQPDETFIEVE